MTFSSEDLVPETNAEKVEQDRRAGVLGEGLTVTCRPTEDPEVVEQQHRAVCMTKPYLNCHGCQHSTFTLVFNAEKKLERLEMIQCPRWEGDEADRLDGKSPDYYVPTEVATCEVRPFPYCASCPNAKKLALFQIDKTKEGWYSRFQRFTKEDDDG